MPMCPVCDADNPAGAVACGGCFAPLPGAGDVQADGGGRRSATRTQRPTGLTLIVSGWLAGAAGFVLALVALGERASATTDAPSVGPGNHELVAVAGDAFWAGFFLLLAGYVVRAIWFLPGADMKPSS